MHIKKIKLLFFIISLLIVTTSSVFAKETTLEGKTSKKVWNLEHCVNVALENDPEIKIAKDKVKVMKSRVGQAKSDYFPTLSGGTGYNFTDNSTSGSGVSGGSTNNTYQVNVGVNMLIWNFGKTTAKINMNKYNMKASQYDLDYATLTTIYKVKTAYYTVLAAVANLDIMKRAVEINTLHYERTKALFEEGLKSKIDVVNAEVYLTEAKVDYISTESKFIVAMMELNNAMYNIPYEEPILENTENFNFKPLPSSKEIDVSYSKKKEKDPENITLLTSGISKDNMLTGYKFNPFKMDLQEALNTAYENRPDLKSLTLVQNAQEESLRAIKRTYYPSITAGGNYSINAANQTRQTFSVNAGLNLPTINGMDIKYKIDEGKSLLDIAVENVSASRKNIYFDIYDSFITMKQQEKKIPLMEEKVRQSLENFELADGRYMVGLGNFIELQEAQTNYYKAQLSFVQCIFDYNMYRVLLQKSMGIKGDMK